MNLSKTTELDEVWQCLAKEVVNLEIRPSFRLDPEFYVKIYPEIEDENHALLHWDQFGKGEGRFPNNYKHLSGKVSDLDSIILDLVSDSTLQAVIQEKPEEGFELAFELLRIPGIDESVSHFSAQRYHQDFPETKQSPLLPFEHYVLYGKDEGREIGGGDSDLKFGEIGRTSGDKKQPKTANVLPKAKPKAALKASDDLQIIWAHYKKRFAPELERDDFHFDKEYYLSANPDLKSVPDLETHFNSHGREEGRHANAYARVREASPNLDSLIVSLLKDSLLKELMRSGRPDAGEMVFEILRLPSADEQVSKFSGRKYRAAYPDIADAGVDPLFHYLVYGHAEGRVGTIGGLNKQVGLLEHDSAKPNCLIFQHELSRTGSPVVGRELAQAASESHNPYVVTLRGGALEKDFLKHCCRLYTTAVPDEHLDEFWEDDPSIQPENIDFAIVNSVESGLFGPWLAKNNIPFAIYIHEYAELTLPILQRYRLVALADCIIFSSEVVRSSWNATLRDLGIDLETRTAILPQRPMRIRAPDAETYAAARRQLSEVIGKDLSASRIVYGAGSAHWRKGTDYLVMAAQLMKKSHPDTHFIWIGDGFNPEDYNFGIWIASQLQHAGVDDPDGNISILAPGPLYDAVRYGSDVHFMSSRQDPLPNVVFDATEAGCRVVRFENATGFDDERYNELPGFFAVEFGHIQDAVEVLSSLPKKLDEPIESCDVEFVPPYVGISNFLREVSTTPQATETAVEHLVDVPIVGRQVSVETRRAEVDKLHSLGRVFFWGSKDAANSALQQHWSTKRSSVQPFSKLQSELDAPNKPFSVYITVGEEGYDAERTPGLDDLMRSAERVVIEGKRGSAEQIAKLLDESEAGPEIEFKERAKHTPYGFLRQMKSEDADAIWANIDLTFSEGRRYPLMPHAFRHSIKHAKIARGLLEAGSVGVVATFLPLIFGWCGSDRQLAAIKNLAGDPPPHPVLDTCNAVWIRASIGREMCNIFGEFFNWPDVGSAKSGTHYHLIEKLWPAVAATHDQHTVFVNHLREG